MKLFEDTMPLPNDVQNLINAQSNQSHLVLEWEVFGNAADETRFVLTFRKKNGQKDADEKWLLRKSFATTFESTKEKANREKLERKLDKIEKKMEKNEAKGNKDGERMSLRERLKERTEKKVDKAEKKAEKNEQKENTVQKSERLDKKSDKVDSKENIGKRDGLVQKHEQKMLAKKASLDESALRHISKDEPSLRHISKITSAPSSRRNSTTSLDLGDDGAPLVRRNSSRSSRRTPFRKLKKNEKLYKEGKLQFSLSVENLSELPELSEDSMAYGLSSIVNKKTAQSGDKLKNGEPEDEEEMQSVSSRIADWQRASLRGSKYGGGIRGENFPRTKKATQRAMSMDDTSDIRPRAKTWGNDRINERSIDKQEKENGVTDMRWRLKSSKEKRSMFSETRTTSSSTSSDKPSWASASFLRSRGVYRV